MTSIRGMAIRRAAALVLAVLFPTLTQAIQNCVVCDSPITGEFYLIKSAAFDMDKPMCKPCSSVKTACFACKIPLKQPALALPDGRWLCPEDAPSAVTDQREVQTVFEEVKHQLFPILSGLGKLPQRNISIRMIDANAMAALKPQGQGRNAVHDTLGVAQSRLNKSQEWSHIISTLNGLPRSRLMAVLAHEYAHTWLNENTPEGRTLDKNTTEGFCELVAYLTMDRMDQAKEKRIILNNAYTEGQTETFLQTADQYQLHRVVQWIKSGVDKGLSQANPSRVLEVQKQSQVQPASLKPVPTQVPDELVLRGISGRANRRFALVNDQTLEVNDRVRVRVGTQSVTVRCLEITDHTVRLEVEGKTQPVELELNSPR